MLAISSGKRGIGVPLLACPWKWSYLVSKFVYFTCLQDLQSILYRLGGGFKYCLFSSLLGEMIDFDYCHIFQMGWKCWNHQLDRGEIVHLHTRKLTCPLKRDHFNGKYIFQPLIFRGHVSFPGCTRYQQDIPVDGPHDSAQIVAWPDPIEEHGHQIHGHFEGGDVERWGRGS